MAQFKIRLGYKKASLINILLDTRARVIDREFVSAFFRIIVPHFVRYHIGELVPGVLIVSCDAYLPLNRAKFVFPQPPEASFFAPSNTGFLIKAMRT